MHDQEDISKEVNYMANPNHQGYHQGGNPGYHQGAISLRTRVKVRGSILGTTSIRIKEIPEV